MKHNAIMTSESLYQEL